MLRLSKILVLCGTFVAVRSQNASAPDHFLEKFGYLPAATTHGAYHSPESRREAIKEFQRMAHLPDTGLLDEPTRKMMVAPRCGVPDQFPNRRSNDDPSGLGPQNYELPGLRWKKKKLTWKIHNFTPDLGGEDQRYAIWRAFKYWSDVSGLEFEETEGEADMNIKFAWGDHGDGGGNDFDGPGMILGHAYFPESGMIHFDEEEDWTLREDKGVNLRIVAAHEIGHAIGLSHSTVWEALMAPWYQGYVPESTFKLHVDDMDGVQYLYGRNTQTTRPDPDEGRQPPPVVKPTTTTTTTTTTTAAPRTPQEGPNPCTMTFDAMFNGFSCRYKFREGLCYKIAPDDKVYVLRGKYIFRLDGSGVMRGWPKTIRSVMPRAPYHVSAAVYSRSTGRVYLFKARRIWRYTAGVSSDGSARFRLDRGFPVNKYSDRLFPTPEAALTDARGRVLLLQGDRIYRYSEYYLTASVESERFSTKFPGIPSSLDSAITYQNYMYFFKGDNYYKFASDHGVVAGPKGKAVPWMGCSGPSSPR